MKRIIIISIFIISWVSTWAKESQEPTTYNYQRAKECIYNEQDIPKALEYLNKELETNPKCGYTYAWIAALRINQEEFGRAMTCVNSALKYLPKRDKTYISWSYALRADIYANLKDTVAAIKDYSQAIKIDPNYYQYLRYRSELYFEMKQYSLADEDYKRMLKIDNNDAIIHAYLGLGRNLKEQGKYEQAIEQFSKIITLYGEESSLAFSFRAESELKLKQYEQAVVDIVKALEIDGDDKAYNMLTNLKEPEAIDLMRRKLKLQTIFYPNQVNWFYYLAIFEEVNSQYKQAIATYKKANSIVPDALLNRRIAACYYESGDYASALIYINEAIEADSTNADYYNVRSRIYQVQKDLDLAIVDMDKYISLEPKTPYGYFNRATLKRVNKQYAQALEDYYFVVAIDPDYSKSVYHGIARCYMHLGDSIEARKNYEKVIDVKSQDEYSASTCYAYHYLGQNEKAIEAMNYILEKDSSEAYNAMCLYSLMADTTQALYYLEKTLQDGWVHFAYMEVDEDLDNIRHLENYKKTVDTYRRKVQRELEIDVHPQDSSAAEYKVVEIPFTAANGVTKVNCTINGLPLNFVFDTGASDVSISQVEANFMFKNGYLKPTDVVGKQHYQTADGNISEGTIVNIEKIVFGGIVLDNVRASVVKNQNAPLLLGQSVLKRLGNIEIDNTAKILRITIKQNN